MFGRRLPLRNRRPGRNYRAAAPRSTSDFAARVTFLRPSHRPRSARLIGAQILVPCADAARTGGQCRHAGGWGAKYVIVAIPSAQNTRSR